MADRALTFAAGWEPSPIESEPPAPGRLRLVPLGGLGEIGKNMMAVHFGEDIVVIDCGIMFPTPDMPGIDLVLPNVSYLIRHRQNVRAILLTHGHEDHVGALPYVWPHLPTVPIYGSRLTLGLLESKWEEFGLSQRIATVEVKPGDRVSIGCFEAEFIHVVHSISDSLGIALKTPLGTLVHTGDFKMDKTPMDGWPTDAVRFSALGDQGVLLLLSDSTNAERPGFSSSERIVADSLQEVFSACPGRIIITTFASSIPRLQQIVNTAVRQGRKICFYGRSLEGNVAVATRLEYLKIPSEATVRIEDMAQIPDDRLVLIVTGSQGEPLAGISLMAARRHKYIDIKKGDTVIFSATPVPGNEYLVNQIINMLFRLGAEVVYDASAKSEGMPAERRRIHVSGHASVAELTEMLTLVRPRFFVPVHGEYRMLVHHARLAEASGVDAENVFILEDGEVLEFFKEGDQVQAARMGRVPAGDVLIDGLSVGDVGAVVLRDRNVLSKDGICLVIVAVDRSTGDLISGPEVISRGFMNPAESDGILEAAREVARTFLADMGASGRRALFEERGNLKGALSRFFVERMGRRPVVMPVVLEV